jgi:hypothetical protein
MQEVVGSSPTSSIRTVVRDAAGSRIIPGTSLIPADTGRRGIGRCPRSRQRHSHERFWLNPSGGLGHRDVANGASLAVGAEHVTTVAVEVGLHQADVAHALIEVMATDTDMIAAHSGLRHHEDMAHGCKFSTGTA